MKVLSSKYRESMSDWFGKKGIVWHGIWVVWWDPDAGKLRYYFVNQIVNDSCEDGEIVAQLFGSVLKNHKVYKPNTLTCVVKTDGAGAFSGVKAVARYGYLGILTGIKVIIVKTTEAGGGKDGADRNFAVAKSEMKKTVKAGMGEFDVVDAQTLIKNLLRKPTPSTINVLVATKRNNIEPRSTKEVKKAGLQRISHKEFVYGEGDESMVPKKIECWQQSGMGGKPEYIIDVPALWPRDAEAVGGIISIATIADGDAVIPQDVTASVAKPGNYYTIQEREEIKKEIKENRVLKAEKHSEEFILRTKSEEMICPVCFLCPFPGCIRQYFSEKCLANHIEGNKHQSNGSCINNSSRKMEPTKWDKMTIHDMAIEALNDVTVAPDAIVIVPATIASEATVTSFNDSIAMAQDFPLSVEITNSLFVFGWACKVLLKHPPLHQQMVQFLKWYSIILQL